MACHTCTSRRYAIFVSDSHLHFVCKTFIIARDIKHIHCRYYNACTICNQSLSWAFCWAWNSYSRPLNAILSEKKIKFSLRHTVTDVTLMPSYHQPRVLCCSTSHTSQTQRGRYSQRRWLRDVSSTTSYDSAPLSPANTKEDATHQYKSVTHHCTYSQQYTPEELLFQTAVFFRTVLAASAVICTYTHTHTHTHTQRKKV